MKRSTRIKRPYKQALMQRNNNQTDKFIQDKEYFFQSVFSSIRDGVSILDNHFNIIRVNPAMERWYAHQMPLVGKKCYQAYHGRKIPCKVCPYKQTIRTGKPAYEIVPRTGRGDQINGSIGLYTFPFIDAKTGGQKGVIEYVRDITEQVQAEESLKESEEKFRTLAERSPHMIFINNLDRIVYANQQCEESMEYKREHFYSPDFNFMSLIAPEDRKTLISNFKKHQKGQEIPPYEYTLITKNGKRIEAIISTKLIKYNGGQAILGVVTDITKQKQMERDLAKSRDYLDRILNGMYEAVMVVDRDHIIRDVNNCFLNLYKVTRKEVIGKHCYVIGHRLHKPCGHTIKCPRKEVFEGKKAVQAEHIHFDGNGNEVIIEIYAFPLLEENGKVKLMVEIHHDITKRKKAEEEVKRKLTQLHRSLEQTINSLALAGEVRDPYTAGHQRRVSELSCAIAREMNLSEMQINGIKLAGIIHDIGKIAIPSEILTKPSTLTETEYSMIKTHSMVGYDILKSIEFPWPIAQFVLQHHEKFNGTGYPQGLEGKDILLEAKILCLADSVDVMCTYRPYRPALSTKRALSEIRSQSGILYDPKVVKACLQVFRKKKFSFGKY
ncbi:MAG: PAS domain S-box protein [Planctomycetes bacterium]|nr:PAS domain S-box protein [Planctomycetota bacterium]